MSDLTVPFTREGWEARHLDADGNLIPAPDNGAVPGQRVRFHDVQAFLADFPSHVEQVGDPDGEFLTILGGEFDARALLPDDAERNLHAYAFTGHLPAGWQIEIGTTAPIFGRGGGSRYVVVYGANGAKMSVYELLDTGVLTHAA